MEKWTETDERNVFLTSTNTLEANTDMAVDKIKKISYGDIELKNFAKIYKNKVFQTNELLRLADLSFFGQSSKEIVVRQAISNYLTTEILELSEMLNILVNKIYGLQILYYSQVTSKLANRIVRKFVEQYEKKLKELADFSLVNNLKDIMLETLLDDRYYLYAAGYFMNFYNYIREIMTTLGLSAVFEQYDKELFPYVIAAEEARTTFAEKERLAKNKQIDLEKCDMSTLLTILDDIESKDVPDYSENQNDTRHR